MKKRAAVERKNQGPTTPEVSMVLQQLTLPLLMAVEATKKGLYAFIQQMGMLALSELLAAEAERIAGPKGRHASEREYHHWGSATTTLPFGGRHVSVERPRVRGKGKGSKEVELPSLQTLRETDPMTERVLEQIAVGVSTRGYERSLEEVEDETMETRATSKSNISRSLIDGTTEKLAEFLNRKLDDLKLVAIFIDGIEVAKHAVVIALGITRDGTKEPLGVWAGSTENATLATGLLQNLIERGMRISEKTLFVIDGGKGIRKAINQVFGNQALVQRCQVHKLRNVRDHLPEARRAHVTRQMREAYKSRNASTAKKMLVQLASWLEANGEESAAESLREGLDETLTVLRLGLPAILVRSFSTTNAIENLNGTIRRVLRNVKRWRGEGMIRRWVALGIAEAQRGFRRIKGYKQIGTLVVALAAGDKTMVEQRKVA